ncbi:hypothetical protein SU69_00695 [Thermosipho melanesiensis]|uniref:Uncharacterized protein n=2 Tax=Thermosipho melanesiensis TaxID=46541 RepID=A6LJA3_THEM4|nr:hypothetical protein [Thermosipho melanesiensis]ABR30004.1 hypothetical protein Tmel_0127 [Thermosipho melanesiensis BI429]APT73208.1 hypothetical protein BW47_00715 [Thermosipho melanesiensis]OOC38602.1 hypothetical protein SU68_00695 [Thermosipho melanesiensis]OOC40406.1 hypothetical protein SU70_00695 [Thermosipho melanesiensis]OOC40670.1 hypothetical protein SU69_00695 [Thermosipho melanesiensis]
MNFFKNLLNKLKDFLGKLKVDKLIDILKSIYKRKVLLFLSVIVVVIVVSLSILLTQFLKNKSQIEINSQQEMTIVKNLYINIPKGAFPYEKSFNLNPLTPETAPTLFENAPFIDTVYDVIPKDGKKDFAYIPLTFRYYFPADYFYGIDYNNVALAYIPEDGSAYRIFPGSYIGKDEKGYFVEAQSFHSSKVGIVALNPKKQELGIKVLVEKLTPKPSILVVPGTDRNFKGYFKSDDTPDLNFWSVVFSDRTIMIYNYPLYEVRSKLYKDMVDDYFKRSELKSYIEFEAERLASELKRFKNFKFDIVAQDIGGLIVAYCLVLHPEISNVRNIAFVSVPFRGTNVANPVYFGSLLYGKSSDALSKIYNLDSNVISSLQTHIYTFIETINTYWSEILPDSKVLEKLVDLSKKNNVKMVSFMGTKPPFGVDVKGSTLEKFYPELVKGTGDGVVSVTSAKLKDMELVQIDGDAYTFYSSNDFVEKLKQLFEFGEIKIPEYKDDNYREYVSKTEKEKEVYLSKLRPYRFDGAKISDSIIVDFEKKLDFPGNQIAIFKSVIYTGGPDGLYGNGTKLLEGPIFNLKRSFGGVSFRTPNEIYFYSPAIKKKYNVVYVTDFLATQEGVYTANNAGEIVSFWDPSGNKIIDLKGQYGRIKVVDNYLIMFTNKQIYIPKLELLLNVPEFENKGIDISDVIIYRNEVLAVTRSYGFLFYDIGSTTGNYIGEGWIGNISISRVGNYLLTVGKNFITIIDIPERRVLRIIEKLDTEVLSTEVDDEYLYLVTKTGILKYKVKKD